MQRHNTHILSENLSSQSLRYSFQRSIAIEIASRRRDAVARAKTPAASKRAAVHTLRARIYTQQHVCSIYTTTDNYYTTQCLFCVTARAGARERKRGGKEREYNASYAGSLHFGSSVLYSSFFLFGFALFSISPPSLSLSL